MNIFGVELDIVSYLFGGISAIIPMLIAAHISGFFTYYFQKKIDAEKQHFADIKEYLQGLNQELNESYGNNLNFPLNLNKDGFAFELFVMSGNEDLIKKYSSWRNLNPIHKDIANHHYPDLISRIKEIEENRVRYYLNYVKFRELLLLEIKKFEESCKIIYTEHILMYIIQQKLMTGFSTSFYVDGSSTEYELKYAHYSVAKGKDGASIEKLKTELENYAVSYETDKKFKELLRKKTNLQLEAVKIQSKIQELLKDTKLPGNCKYLYL